MRQPVAARELRHLARPPAPAPATRPALSPCPPHSKHYLSLHQIPDRVGVVGTYRHVGEACDRL